MGLSSQAAATDVAVLVDEYRGTANLGTLIDQLRAMCRRFAPEELVTAVAPHRDMPEVVIPVYEYVVAERPTDAQAMVTLANAYWLTGRGPEVVGTLAARAIDADASNRGAWHLWALAEADLRTRVERWRTVAERFPWDQLARAALADNAASLAGTEHDPVALALAISTYDGLLAETTQAHQRAALESTLTTLRSWKL
jgi:hypothetical protein